MQPTDDPYTQRSSDEQQQSHELQKAVDYAQDVLLRAESTFPFVLFPDIINVSRMKVTVTRRSFFRVAEVISLQIGDILNVEADVGPFFGSLSIFTRTYGAEPLRITFLSRKSTIDAQRIIEGFMIAKDRDIEISDIKTPELIQLLTQLGGDAPPS